MRLSIGFALILSALCAFFAGPASAAGVYTVSGVRVDITATDAARARDEGFALAQRTAWERLVKRVTIPDELARAGVPQLTGLQLDQIVAGVDIEEERRSGTRYIARLGVNFDPSSVRRILRERGLAAVDTRGAVLMVSPQLYGTPEVAGLWRATWEQGGFADELIPVAVAPIGLVSVPDWGAAEPYAAAAGASSALFATVRSAGPNFTMDLVEVGPNGARREWGQVTTPMATSEAGQIAAFQALASAANDRIQSQWKVRLATGAGQRARLAASAIYDGQAQWARLKRGLEGAASTLISEIRIEAVAKTGAMVSFSYVGAPDQLQAELGRNGILLEQTPQGAVLRVAPGGT